MDHLDGILDQMDGTAMIHMEDMANTVNQSVKLLHIQDITKEIVDKMFTNCVNSNRFIDKRLLQLQEEKNITNMKPYYLSLP